MSKKVLIPTKLESISREILLAHGGYEVVQDDKTPLLEQAAKHPDAYALIVRSEKINKAVIDAFPSLKVIVRAGTGYDSIDIKHARVRGIDVMNTPGANANAVAEEVVALMLADARKVIPADTTTRAGQWEKKSYMGREVTGKTIGVVGLGNIGRLVIKRLAGFDCRFLGYDPMLSRERAASINVDIVDLPALFEKSDYITLHIPENAETRGMINEALLARMKKGATLINCARAGILDEAALRKVKAEKGIRFLTDVYPEDKPGVKTVADIADIMLPHLGASTIEANTNAARRAAEELIEFDDKGLTSFVVNREAPEGLDEAFGDLAYTLSRLCRHLIGENVQPKLLETSFYGSLEPFGEWLMIPVVRALCENVDPFINFNELKQYMKEMGIDVVNRQPDPNKAYDNSITIDITGNTESGQVRHASVRGTIAENTLMISRINDFDKLYFEPKGPTIFFLYEDRPGVLGLIGTALAEANINIEDVRNPHHPKVNQSLAMMRINKPVPLSLMNAISEHIRSLASYFYDFSK